MTRDRVYVSAGTGTSFEGWLHALDPVDGDEEWVREGAKMRSPAATVDEVVVPALDAEVYTSGGRRTRVFSPSGHVIWTPAVTADAYVTVGTGGILTARPRRRGDDEPDWWLDIGGRPLSGPTVADDLIFLVDRDAALLACDYASGDERWRRSLEGDFASRPAVADGAVFVGTGAGSVYAFE